tara:strand:- start:5993 stop:6730 length:738 start_codon:yes stop_codon:yes gene_type:complete
MFKIDSEKELLSFLKILSEESVKKSKSVLREKSPDGLSSSFDKRLEKETDLYEQEEDADPELAAGDAEVEEKEEEDTSPEDSSGDKDDAAAKSKPEEELRASLDSLERNINSLRAGKSLKDSTVEAQLEIYFDRLGDDEKSLMVLFIRELSKILSGKVTGDDAVNPNQEPYNLDVIQADEEEVEQVPDEEETPAEVEPSAEEEPAADTDEEEDEEEEEDNSPPIQVGQQQNLAEIRKKIKKLMRS